MASLATGTSLTDPAESAKQNENNYSNVGGERDFHIQNWKTKADQAKKAEYFRNLEKCRAQIANLEKDKNGNLYSKKNDFRAEYSSLEEFEQKLADSRKAEKIKTERELSKIHNQVRKLQQQLKDVKPTPEFVSKLREMMEEVDNAICTFKDNQRVRYEELMKEEKTTSNELNVLEKKIEVISNSAPENSFKAPCGKTPVEKITTHLPEEVVTFERFLQKTGGRLGGWDDFDHQSFLKVWTKHKGKPSYLEEALSYLPSRTKDDVQQHEAWYQEFLFLDERKKEAIQEWKAKKQLEKEEISKLQVKAKEILEINFKEMEAQKHKLEEQRRKKQQELESWRKQKEIDAAAQIQARLREEEEQQRKQRKERERQFHVKLVVETHARLRKEKDDLLRLEKEMQEEIEREEKRKMAVYEICRFQDRDQRKLEEKAQDKRAKEEVEAEKERRLIKLKEK
ncbi:hypothetical protein GDO86_002180, partial [Hymenochirus boettgeri]